MADISLDAQELNVVVRQWRALGRGVAVAPDEDKRECADAVDVVRVHFGHRHLPDLHGVAEEVCVHCERCGVGSAGFCVSQSFLIWNVARSVIHEEKERIQHERD